jgi:hypothetical protein
LIVIVRCFGPEASAVINGRLDFGLLGRLPQALHRHLVVLQVDAVLALELLRDVVYEDIVHVCAAELGVAAGGHDLETALLPHLHYRDVERPSAEVEDEDLELFSGLLQAVREACGSRLVDYP